MYAIGPGSTVADNVVSDFSAGRFDGLVNLTGGHSEALGHNLEVIDQRFHLGLHLFAIGQNHVRRIGLPRPVGHPFQSLRDDARALAHFVQTDAVPRVDIVFGPRGDLEIELVVARIGFGFADVEGHAGRAYHRPGDAQVEHVLKRNEAHALRADLPDGVRVEQLFVLIYLAGERADELADG